MNKERLVSVVGGRANKVVGLSKPSELIPFKGKFPLLEPYQMESFHKAIEETMYIDDLPEDIQSVVMKGNRIVLLEQGFQKYLSEVGMKISDFLNLNNSDKSNYLVQWMNKDCIDFKQLKID